MLIDKKSNEAINRHLILLTDYFEYASLFLFKVYLQFTNILCLLIFNKILDLKNKILIFIGG